MKRKMAFSWFSPTSPAEQSSEETEVQTTERKIRSILNKLTPQNFDALVCKFQELGINCEEKLQRFIHLVFEKVVDEPGLSYACARVFQELAKHKVPSSADPSKKASFRKLFITRCQKEFERDYTDRIAEGDEGQAPRRSLGIICLIGELYNLKMLCARIMHECMIKLLASSNEHSLESLCKLLITAGKNLENETNRRLAAPDPTVGIRHFDHYFKGMAEIIEGKQTSSRVRFMLQDLIDLRRDGWRP